MRAAGHTEVRHLVVLCRTLDSVAPHCIGLVGDTDLEMGADLVGLKISSTLVTQGWTPTTTPKVSLIRHAQW